MRAAAEAAELLPAARDLADRLASMPPMHLALTKQAVLRGLTREPWDAAALESWGQSKAMASADFREGVAAFTERRPPRFTGS